MVESRRRRSSYRKQLRLNVSLGFVANLILGLLPLKVVVVMVLASNNFWRLFEEGLILSRGKQDRRSRIWVLGTIHAEY